MTAKVNPYADLPRVVYIVGETDYGEYGAALCPHCGAKGRYVRHFVCEDGSERSAMAGCFKKFRMHPLAVVHARILEKSKEYAERGWNLPSWDESSLRAIEDFAHGAISQEDAWKIVENNERARNAWLARRYGNGRRR